MSNIQEVKVRGGNVIVMVNNNYLVWEIFCNEVLTIREEHPSMNPTISIIPL
jgi:glucosamine 6-phosphate synthetase-like amidotransferase/phosphosugar isomerase protein